LSVDGVDRGLDGDASVEGCHSSRRSSSSRGKNIADRDILDELGIEVGLGVRGAQNM
jgi:hypothetical protein